MAPHPFRREQLQKLVFWAWTPVLAWFFVIAVGGEAIAAGPGALLFFLPGIPLALWCGAKLTLEHRTFGRTWMPAFLGGPSPAFHVELLSKDTDAILEPTWGRAFSVTLRLLRPVGIASLLGLVGAVATVFLFALLFRPTEREHLLALGQMSSSMFLFVVLLTCLIFSLRGHPRSFAKPVTDFYVSATPVEAAGAAAAPVAASHPASTAPTPVHAAPTAAASTNEDSELEELRRRVAEAERKKNVDAEEAAAREREKAALRRRLQELEK